jgi:hypothetical protein
MTVEKWLPLALGALGFLMTWTGIWFGFGRAVEQLKAALKKEIEQERDKILSKIDELEEKFRDDQQSQDHRFGEVGAAMRQYIADVEKKVREVEIWGRDHFVQKEDLKSMLEQLRSDFKEAVGEIKEDIRQLLGKH